jgi:hypothetical protein
MTNLQGGQTTAKPQKMLKKFDNSSTKTVAEQSMSSQTPLGSAIEISRENSKNAPHRREVCSPTVDK